ncbi:MAG: hypothetical protein O7B35_15325, partial [Deltaproteobacteria bacterium]|nr:hypothetical protein [Deltaproteobacteria bacterium]
IEGLLAIYGLSSIEIESPGENWEAESEEERAQLELFSFGPSRKSPPDEARPMITFDLVARSFLAARRARSTEVALSFFRKGRNDFLEKRHIEADYDFYFMFESLFGCGKTKNYQVKAEFKKASQLRSALEEILSAPQPLADFRPGPQTLAEFEGCYCGKTVDEVIDGIVELRGFLHHYTAERPGIWHPEGHAPYECHAMFLVRVAQTIAFKLSRQYIFSDEAVTEYQQMYKGVRELTRIRNDAG